MGEIKELNAVYAIEGSTHAMLERLAALLEAHLNELDGRISELQGLRSVMSSYREHISLRGRSDQANQVGEVAPQRRQRRREHPRLRIVR